MTSMPASRSARAMIFAPRSCPSRPGLATTTRILRLTVSGIGAGKSMTPRPQVERLRDLDVHVHALEGAHELVGPLRREPVLERAALGVRRRVEVPGAADLEDLVLVLAAPDPLDGGAAADGHRLDGLAAGR